MSDARPHVVIIGGGFGGLNAARGLRRAPVRVTLIDRKNHHLFQPLLYEVATAALSAPDIAAPIRRIFSGQRNVEVLLARARSVDPETRTVHLAQGEIGYDYLVLATGVRHAYFGHEEWSQHAPGLKTVDDAFEIRRRFLLAFETAEREADESARRASLTFVIVGAGPTGVELAGTMCELARRAIPRDFRFIDTTTTRVILVEGRDRVLPTFDETLSARAQRDLEALGVEVRLNNFVTHIDGGGVRIGDEAIAAHNVFWAAGVAASSLGRTLDVPLDESGRVKVGEDLSVPGHPEVFVVGDLVSLDDPRTGEPIPGVAPAAMQMGRYAAKVIAAEVRAGGSDRPRPPFRYRDKGMLATIGRARAVGSVFGLRWRGLPAWLLWAVVHIFFLIGFRNRLIVMLRWAWAYFVFSRGARVITGETEPQLHEPREDQEDAAPS